MISSANSVMYTRFWLLTMYWSTNSAIVAPPALPAAQDVRQKITGNSRIELAKMIGITPDWLTLSGM